MWATAARPACSSAICKNPKLSTEYMVSLCCIIWKEGFGESIQRGGESPLQQSLQRRQRCWQTPAVHICTGIHTGRGRTGTSLCCCMVAAAPLQTWGRSSGRVVEAPLRGDVSGLPPHDCQFASGRELQCFGCLRQWTSICLHVDPPDSGFPVRN